MSTSPSSIAGEVRLFSELRQRPGLLVWELLWRWGCGGCLLGLAAWDASRIWASSLPALRVSGILAISADSVLQQPSQFLAMVGTAVGILRPPVERAAWGLAPLMVFCWVLAFALGRGAVLARYDARLLRRPFLLATCEGLRLCLLFAVLGLWVGLMRFASAVALGGETPNLLLYGALVAAGTGVLLSVWPRLARCLVLSMALGLLEPLPFGQAYGQAWRWYGGSTVRQAKGFRKAARRARLVLFLILVVCTFFPTPFEKGWPMVVWWSVLSLLPLVAADAARLGILFTLLRVVRVLRADPVRLVR
jgi:hypothetical protein